MTFRVSDNRSEGVAIPRKMKQAHAITIEQQSTSRSNVINLDQNEEVNTLIPAKGAETRITNQSSFILCAIRHVPGSTN